MLSISIVTYKSDINILYKLLLSLVEAINYLPKSISIDKILIIDNTDIDIISDALLKEFRYRIPQLEIQNNQENIGYGAAHNLAISKSVSKYHLILNPDVLLARNNLYIGLMFLEENPCVAAVSPNAVDAFDNTLYLTKKYPSIMDLLLRAIPSKLVRNVFAKKMFAYENKDIVDSGSINKVLIISGCYMLCRRSYLQEVNYFNDKYFLYFEDFALSLELNKKGKIVYHPAVRIIHYGGGASRKGLRHIVHFVRSAIRFFNTYGWKIY